MSDATTEELRASIVPKSDQLNADDLLTGPITVTIEKVRRGDKEQPIIIDITGQRPYKPCKSMRRILIAAFGEDAKDWVGQRLTLFCDPEVVWAGVKVGGIRISHLSGLSGPTKFLVTQSRGKRAEMTIHPIVDGDASTVSAWVAKAEAAMKKGQLADQLILKVKATDPAKLSQTVKDQIIRGIEAIANKLLDQEQGATA